MCVITMRRGSKRKTRILWDSETEWHSEHELWSAGVGQYRLYTGANDAVMRTFVILAQTFTSAKPGPRRQHKKLRRVSAPESWSGSKAGSNDSVLRREMASWAQVCDPGFVGHFLSSSLLWPRCVGLCLAVMRPNDLTRHSDSKPKLPVITGPATWVEGWAKLKIEYLHRLLMNPCKSNGG